MMSRRKAGSPATYFSKYLPPLFGLSIFLAACESAEVPQAPRTQAVATTPTATQPELVGTMIASNAPAAALFGAVRSPTHGQALVYGAYTRGCIAGAEQLPLDAAHWQVLNPS